MHPEICKIGPLTIYSYGFMLVLAFFVSVALASRQARKSGIDGDFIFNFSFLVFICGILGARAFYVIENSGYYFQNPLEIFMLSRGGMSWFGGLFLGVAAGVFFLKRSKYKAYAVLDLLVPFVVLAQSLGRIGCFLNGCCFGKESLYGVYSPLQGAVLIPTQIYSSLALLIIFVILRFFQERKHRAGQIFYMYLFLYSVKRFIIEFFRADNKVFSSGLTLFQLLSLVIFIISSFMLFKIFTKK